MREALVVLFALLCGGTATASVTAVDLSSAFNVNAAYTDGTTFPSNGGLDGVGSAYSGTLLGGSLAWSGVTFTLGPANQPNGARNRTITLPSGQFGTLLLLGAGVNGDQVAQAVRVNYTDGTSSTFTQTFSNWLNASPNVAGQSIALTTAYRNKSTGVKDNRAFNLYGYTFALTGTKTVASLVLPATNNVSILAAALRTASATATATATWTATATRTPTPTATRTPTATATTAIDVTFYVVSDTHADPPQDSYDLRAMARAVNAVAQSGTWPASIGGTATGFVGGKIGAPRGVVFTGDLMGWGTYPTESLTFRHYFEAGFSTDSILFPAYLGLGNHDVDSADRPADLAAQYRNAAWAWIDSRHEGSAAPVPVTRFDAGSHAYSWDWGGVHFVQTHRFAGDVQYGLPSGLPFLSADLRDSASDGRPVFVFHHYGMDAFGTQDRWWTAAQRSAYRATLNGYNVAGIFAGHSHYAMQYTWENERVFQVNNAKAEINTGNNDGNGSFAIVRITNQRLNVVTCRWLDDAGHYELIGPFYSGPAVP
jgi:cytolysin (calcineurin-like family phosphatase)